MYQRIALLSVIALTTVTASGGDLRQYLLTPPAPCDPDKPSSSGTVFIKVGLQDRVPVAYPRTCTILPGTEVLWVSDSTITRLWLRFDATGNGPTPDDDTADAKGAIDLKSGTGSGGAEPIGIIGRSKAGTYAYTLSIDGDRFVPNPSIIIKPGRITYDD